MKRLLILLVTFILLHLLVIAAYAEEAKKSKKTTLNFEDELVEGEYKSPDLFYILQKKQFNFGRLIKLRENFVPEMRKNSEDIKVGGK